MAPMLSQDAVAPDSGWQERLAEDYRRPGYHVSLRTASGGASGAIISGSC